MLSELSFHSLSDDRNFISNTIESMLNPCPLIFVDIGARGGMHDVVFNIARYTFVLAFEPDKILVFESPIDAAEYYRP